MELLQDLSARGSRFVRGGRHGRGIRDTIGLAATGPRKLRQVSALLRRGHALGMFGKPHFSLSLSSCRIIDLCIRATRQTGPER